MPPKKKSLTSQLDSYTDADSEELSALVESLQHDYEDSATLARPAPTLQTAQDPLLDDYISFCRKILKVLPKDDNEYDSLSQREKDLGLFPEDQEELYKRVGAFFMYVASTAQGRSQAQTAYAELIQYRKALISWATRAHDSYGLADIPRDRLFRKTTESIEFAVKRYDLPLPKNSSEIVGGQHSGGSRGTQGGIEGDDDVPLETTSQGTEHKVQNGGEA